MNTPLPQNRLRAELDRVSGLRERAHEDEVYRARRTAFRAWQAQRLARTHADLLASPRFHDAAQFFLSDLYGPQDISAHADDVKRIVPAMVKMLPAAAIDTVADAIELDALSEDLDSAMIAALGSETSDLSTSAYAEAYRKVGRRADRGRQIDLIAHLGNSLDSLTRQKFIGAALKMMRKPAELAGLGGLQSFLERGYAAFRTMRGGSEFVAAIAERERSISLALFCGEDAALA